MPIAHLEMTSADDFHMCLAHLVGGKSGPSKIYTEHFQDMVAQGKFVLMDNGAAEKEQLDLEELLERYAIINPTEIILPDTVLDTESTLKRSSEFLKMLIERDLPYKRMAVPQGETLQEWRDCLKEMLTWPIDSIGISKFLTIKLGKEARMDAVKIAVDLMAKRGIHKEIHLLGCNDHPTEIGRIVQKYPDAIRSTDSAIAFIYSKYDLAMNFANMKRPAHHMSFFEDKTENVLLLARNKDRWVNFSNGRVSKL